MLSAADTDSGYYEAADVRKNSNDYGSCGGSHKLRCGLDETSRLPCLSDRWWIGSAGGGMRYHKPGLSALAEQPSHQFDKEGVLLLKEKQDSFFRRSEVSCERWCRLRGNLLFYFKSRDHWEEAAGVLVLENCSLGVEDTAPCSFTIEFCCGSQQVCEAITETERNMWVAAIKRSSLQCLREKMEYLQEEISKKRSSLNVITNKVAVSSPSLPTMEVSLSCDNLLCDVTGSAPSAFVEMQLMTQASPVWRSVHSTEVIKCSSNPSYVSTVVLRSSPTYPLEDSVRVKLVVRKVLESFSNTSVIMGFALTSLGSVRSSVNQRLCLISPINGDSVGFVSILTWAGEEECSNDQKTPNPHCKVQEHNMTHGIATHSQLDSHFHHHRRTQSLPPRLITNRGKLIAPPQLSEIYTNPHTANYRLHSGLGGDISVVEVMAETSLSFLLPMQLLVLWQGAERAWRDEVEALGQLSEPWVSRQRDLVAMHSSRLQVYSDSLTAISAALSSKSFFKRSTDKSNPLLEFAPINLHLQRMWAQNESLKRTGCYDLHTVGAFSANTLGFAQGGLLTLLQNQSRKSRADVNGRAECSKAAVDATRRIRAALAQDLNVLVEALRTNKLEGTPQTLMEIKAKIDLLLSSLETDMVENAFDFLEKIRLPQSPSHSLTLASRNYSVHSDLAGYLSPESSLDRTLSLHTANLEKNDETTNKKMMKDSNPDKPTSAVRNLKSDGILSAECENVEARYYCSTDEPEPWDLIKLNLQASFICLSAKVSHICSAYHEATNAKVKVSPDSTKEGLRSTDYTQFDASVSSSETSPTEDDSGISMQEKVVKESSRVSDVEDSKLAESKSNTETERVLRSPSKERNNLNDPNNSNKPKLESIMETSRENLIDSEVCHLPGSHGKHIEGSNSGTVVENSNNPKGQQSIATQNPDMINNHLNTDILPEVFNLESVIPGIIKLKGALDGAVRTARLVHSLHRLQLPTESLHEMHSLQYRRDVCFSQALTAATTALLNKFWNKSGSVHHDQLFLTVLQNLGPLLQFECLLSCIGGDFGRISDMAVAVEDLTTVKFVLVNGKTPTPKVTGNRCNLKVLLPVPEAITIQLNTHNFDREAFSFHVTPVFFNVGINEEATVSAKLGQDAPQHRNNLDSYQRLAEYYNRYSKLSLPQESNKRMWSHYGNYLDISEMISKLKTAVNSTKSKNTEVLTLAASITRAMSGCRFTSCKSAKDRTGMSVTLEQTSVLTNEFDLAQVEVKRCLSTMRSEGTRMYNVQKNIGCRKYAFTMLQLAMFPKEYIPPHGSFGSKIT